MIALVALVVVVLALSNAGLAYALIYQGRAQIEERASLLASVGALRRQQNRADLSRTAREYEQAEAIGHAIEETARRNHTTAEFDPPLEGMG